jgi:hypothetical protein
MDELVYDVLVGCTAVNAAAAAAATAAVAFQTLAAKVSELEYTSAQLQQLQQLHDVQSEQLAHETAELQTAKQALDGSRAAGQASAAQVVLLTDKLSTAEQTNNKLTREVRCNGTSSAPVPDLVLTCQVVPWRWQAIAAYGSSSTTRCGVTHPAGTPHIRNLPMKNTGKRQQRSHCSIVTGCLLPVDIHCRTPAAGCDAVSAGNATLPTALGVLKSNCSACSGLGVLHGDMFE